MYPKSNPPGIQPGKLSKAELDQVVEWHDPWPGKAQDGSEKLVTVCSQTTAAGAIALARASAYAAGTLPPETVAAMSERQLLDEFLVVNWATLKPRA